MHILTGDFKAVLEKADSSPYYNYSPVLGELVESFHLIDVYIHLQKKIDPEHTCFQGSSNSRIDRVYISIKLISYVHIIERVHMAVSNHLGVLVSVDLPSPQTLKSHI